MRMAGLGVAEWDAGGNTSLRQSESACVGAQTSSAGAPTLLIGNIIGLIAGGQRAPHLAAGALSQSKTMESARDSLLRDS